MKFGPDAYYQPILGDEAGSTPIRTGIQTSQPGYVAPMHSHPYLEVFTSWRAPPRPGSRAARTAG